MNKLDEINANNAAPGNGSETYITRAKHFNPMVKAVNELDDRVIAITPRIPDRHWFGTIVRTHVSATITEGPLEVGQRYRITSYSEGDDFTNVGALSNEANQEFIATGDTPTTWTNGSELLDYAFPLINELENTTGYRLSTGEGNNGQGSLLGATFKFFDPNNFDNPVYLTKVFTYAYTNSVVDEDNGYVIGASCYQQHESEASAWIKTYVEGVETDMAYDAVAVYIRIYEGSSTI